MPYQSDILQIDTTTELVAEVSYCIDNIISYLKIVNRQGGPVE